MQPTLAVASKAKKYLRLGSRKRYRFVWCVFLKLEKSYFSWSSRTAVNIKFDPCLLVGGFPSQHCDRCRVYQSFVSLIKKGLITNEPRKNPLVFQHTWLFGRDPYNTSLKSPHHWVVCHLSEISVNNQVPFFRSNVLFSAPFLLVRKVGNLKNLQVWNGETTTSPCGFRTFFYSRFY